MLRPAAVAPRTTGPAPAPAARQRAMLSAVGAAAGPAAASVAGRTGLLRFPGARIGAIPGSAAAAGMLAASRQGWVDHSQITGACVSCHDGRTAVGRPPQHLATSARCDSCHTTNGWLPARFDHVAMAPGNCASCHDGLRAMGKPRDHVATVQPCGVCHGTLAWQPVRVDHSGLISGCAGCHNNVAATGLTLAHLRTQRDCSVCHRYPDWGIILDRRDAPTRTSSPRPPVAPQPRPAHAQF